MSPSDRIRLRQAALLIGVHPETLRRWAHEGMVTYYSIGPKHVMEFDPKDIEALTLSFKRDRREPPVH